MTRRLLLPVAQCISMVKSIEAALQAHVATISGSLAAILRDHASTILAVVNDAEASPPVPPCFEPSCSSGAQ